MPDDLHTVSDGRAPRPTRKRWWVAGTLATAAAVGAGVVALAPGLIDEHERRAEYLPAVRDQVAYATSAAQGHTVYLPREWTRDLSTYPDFATFVPKDGLYSSGHLDGLWLLVTQFDADAITEDAAPGSTTPETLCEPTGPDGVEATHPSAPKVARTFRSYCFAVPGRDARIRIQVWDPAAGLDPSLDLALALPEHGRVLDVSASGRAVPVDDPVGWAAGFIDDLTEFDPSAYSADEVYEAGRDAGYFEDF